MWKSYLVSSLQEVSLPGLAHAQQYQHLTDEQLVLQYQHTGDASCLGAAMTRYTLLLLGVAMKYLKDKDAAADVVQQVFLKALTHFPKEPVQNFKGWLYILTRNQCLQLLRDSNQPAPEDVLQQIPAEDHVPDVYWKEQSLTEMEEAIKQLTEQQRLAVTLFYLQEKSYQQIMDETGWTFMQVKSYIQNGKRNLKIILAARLRRADL